MPNAFLAGIVRPASMLLAGLVLFGMAANNVTVQAAETGRPVAVNCDVHSTLCRQTISGTEVTLDISPKRP